MKGEHQAGSKQNGENRNETSGKQKGFQWAHRREYEEEKQAEK